MSLTRILSSYNRVLMPVSVLSFAKINLGLHIGPGRADGFHQLRTVYQTIALHDKVDVSVARGSGIEIRCSDRRVPTGNTNTCFRIAQQVVENLKIKRKIIIEIRKRLPIQGGLGGASSNAVATLLGLELALRKRIPGAEKLRIAAEVGSDLPLFLVGGTVLGVGRGEEVYPLPDLPRTYCVIAVPEIGVSTPEAFADWDQLISADGVARNAVGVAATGTPAATRNAAKLTLSSQSDRMNKFGRTVSSWLSGLTQVSGRPASGVPALGRGRAETPLLDLVRTGIENDFEQVVFPKYPELRDVKRVLERTGATYASLSGSGSAIYGLFRTRVAAERAALRVRGQGTPAYVTTTLTRREYWKKFLVSDL
jgi:4-diphosphocytidyl-2-C-methyl-D-erythritol kinase